MEGKGATIGPKNNPIAGTNNSRRDTVKATGDPTAREKNRGVAKREGGSYKATRT